VAAERRGHTAPPRNRLLAGLPTKEYGRLARHLERVTLEARQLLYDVDRPIDYVYFPEDMVASVVSVMTDGTAVETATVGWEGMVGVQLFHGSDRMSAQAFCQVAGTALRMPAEAFRRAIARRGPLADLLHRYSLALLTLVGQSSACNRVHTMRERCARWLLMTHDRVGLDSFPLTQHFLSQMLGVGRAAVNKAIGSLEQDALIDYAYARVTLRDRPGLERASCECYIIIRREFDRLFAGAERPSPLDPVKTAEGGKSVVRGGARRRSPDKGKSA
jgi:CRP-like cAMP-binding protein